jgi:hypothetical protein
MSIYRMPAGTPAASMRLPPGVTSWICANGPAQILTKGKDGRALIPAGERVTIGANFAGSDGYMNYLCSASVSVAPELGGKYYQDFETEGQTCSALVYREVDDKRVGLAFERSMQRGGPGCTR